MTIQDQMFQAEIIYGIARLSPAYTYIQIPLIHALTEDGLYALVGVYLRICRFIYVLKMLGR